MSEGKRPSATENLLNAMTPAEHRQMRAAYTVWRWLEQTKKLPIVQKMFRDDKTHPGGAQ